MDSAKTSRGGAEGRRAAQPAANRQTMRPTIRGATSHFADDRLDTHGTRCGLGGGGRVRPHAPRQLSLVQAQNDVPEPLRPPLHTFNLSAPPHEVAIFVAPLGIFVIQVNGRNARCR